jgi:large subunit ribosomal protein L24e
MVERRVCTFCGGEIEPGTGRMYIKKDGVVYNFCSSKCFKNLVELRRVPRRTTWTRYYEREKSVRMKGLPEVEEKAPKKKSEGSKPSPEKASDGDEKE